MSEAETPRRLPVVLHPLEIERLRRIRNELGIISEEDLAFTLVLAKATLQTWRSRGFGPRYVKVGKRVMYKTDDVKSWLETNLFEPGELAAPTAEESISEAA